MSKFEDWFNEDPDGIVTRIANSPDPMWRIQQAFQAGDRARAKRDMEIADTYESRIKHTSHRDGLGMGSQCCEKVCRYIYDAIKEEK